jgi:hypothetical protein
MRSSLKTTSSMNMAEFGFDIDDNGAQLGNISVQYTLQNFELCLMQTKHK